MVDFVMGLGIALPVVMAPSIATVTGVAQGVSEQKRQNEEQSSRMLKFHLDAYADDDQPGAVGQRLRNGVVTLHDKKLWVEDKDPTTGLPVSGNHPFTGFYIAYPDDNRMPTMGLVSTISTDPPVLNWIYIDKETFEVKFENRTNSIDHHVGDYDWTQEDPRDSYVTFDKWEGFAAVWEPSGGWALYFDMHDDGLEASRNDRSMVEVNLKRRIVEAQELNKWGLKEEGNIGFKKTKEI